jgi:curli biogenesis system outer membrane secretion channel CsgG
MPTARTREEIEDASRDAQRWLEEIDPVLFRDDASSADDLRAIGTALSEVADSERQLSKAVVAARANGRSWGAIGLVLGVSGNAAKERFQKAVRSDAARRANASRGPEGRRRAAQRASEHRRPVD